MRRESPSLYKKSEELWKLQWEHHGQFSDLDCLEYYRQELFFHENCDVKKRHLEESNIYPSSADLINTDFFKNQLTPKIVTNVKIHLRIVVFKFFKTPSTSKFHIQN